MVDFFFFEHILVFMDNVAKEKWEGDRNHKDNTTKNGIEHRNGISLVRITKLEDTNYYYAQVDLP